MGRRKHYKRLTFEERKAIEMMYRQQGYTLNTVDHHVVYDARGNGSGDTVPTLTGDHESRVTDYTALCVRERCGCEGGGKGLLVQKEVAGSLLAENKQFVVAIDRAAFIQGINARYDMEISEDGINSTLTARGPSAVCAAFKYKQGSKARTIAYQEEQSPCLSSEQHDISVVTISAVRRLTPLLLCPLAFLKPRMTNSTQTIRPQPSKCRAVATGGSETLIVDKKPQAVCMATQQGGAEIRTDDKAPTLTAAAGMSGNNQPVYANAEYTVRRLTPLECERLQGFPDGWTDIGEWTDSKGKKHKDSDSSRYKALGNSIALPPWAWTLERLNNYCTVHTMASLFDGIGGFPLIWETINGEGSCLWASEIEDFAVAVTKRRFNGGCHAEA